MSRPNPTNTESILADDEDDDSLRIHRVGTGLVLISPEDSVELDVERANANWPQYRAVIRSTFHDTTETPWMALEDFASLCRQLDKIAGDLIADYLRTATTKRNVSTTDHRAGGVQS